MDIKEIVSNVVSELKKKIFIQVEASGRHIHLSQHDLDSLFGMGYKLTWVKDLSQPGQFVCNERLKIKGPKGCIDNVVILGPIREKSQVEISLTDALTLGISSPIRNSGDVTGTPGITLINGDKQITLEEGLIVAKRHIHITPKDAEKYHVSDNEIVKVKVFGQRPLIFEDTVVRVSKNFCTAIHIDYDEANACGFKTGTQGIIIK